MNLHLRLMVIQLLLMTGIVFAQHQNDNWYMGDGAGMSFKNGTLELIPVGTTNAQSHFFSSSSYSDPVTGDLLFYTDGNKVYNKQHHVMAKGDSLAIEKIVSRSMIIPYPGDSNLYYLFTYEFNGQDSLNLKGTICYATIDLSKNNGLGEVVQKRTILGTRFMCGFTLVQLSYNQSGWWLVTHIMQSDTFFCYRIEDNGIELNPVISASGQTRRSEQINNSNMVASNDGDWILYTDGTQDKHSNHGLFRINKCKGTLSLIKEFAAPVTAYNNDTAKVSEAAFSPGGDVLYLTWQTVNGAGYFIQYDFSKDDPDSALFRLPAPSNMYRDMQLAPDGKIYMTDYSIANGARSKISVINAPDIVGINCDFKYQLYDLNPNKVIDKYVLFLPSFVTNWTTESPEKKVKIVKRNACVFNKTVLYTEKGVEADSLVWDLGDGTISYDQKVTHDYAKGGTYPIVLKWYFCGWTYEVKDSITIPTIGNLLSDHQLTVCNGEVVKLEAKDTMTGYVWSTGDSSRIIRVFEPGMYVLEGWRNNCSGKDSVEVKNYPDVWTSLGAEYFICDKQSDLVKLDAGEGFQKYLWNPTGDTTQWIEVMDLGEYFVIVKDFHGCEGSGDTRVKRRCPPVVFYPNAFTPNGDGVNDDYKPIGDEVISFNLKIYNRWGQLIFETNDITKTWDGKIKDLPAPVDVYFFISTYSGRSSSHQLVTIDTTGNISLIR